MSARPPRPERYVHRGVVHAHGVAIDEAVCGEAVARARILATWHPGTALLRHGTLLLVRWAEPQWIDTRVAHGLALVPLRTPDDGTLTSLPLGPDELVAPPRSIVLAQGGEVHARTASECDPVRASSWLDVDAFEWLAVTPVGAPLLAPQSALPARATNTRSLFHASFAKADASVSTIVKQLRGDPDAAFETPRVGGRVEQPALRRWASLAMAWMLTAVSTVLVWLTRPRSARRKLDPSAPPAPAGTVTQVYVETREPSGPSWTSRLIERMLRFAQGLRALSPIHDPGAAHASYLRELFHDLEHGDVHEGLRRAIPLSAEAGESGDTVVDTWFGTVHPRDALAINASQVARGKVLGFDTALFERIRDQYKRTAARLEAEGRIDEAAFVLAELLHDGAAAVALLERHERWQLAAEIAEARRLPPSTVVRQWMLAGNAGRAVHIARTTGCFSDAVALLNKSHTRHGRMLARAWAESAAASGRYAHAIEIARGVPELEETARAWTETVIEQGGVGAGRMLAAALLRDAVNTDTAVRERGRARLRDWWREGDAGALRVMNAVAQALAATTLQPNEQLTLHALADELARAVMTRGAQAKSEEARKALQALTQKFALETLRTDLPTWPIAAPTLLNQRAVPLSVRFDASDVGRTHVHDAAPLPDGRVLLALGEAGLRLVSPRGRLIKSWDVAAHRLVVSPERTRALAVANRGAFCRVARVSIDALHAQHWLDLQLELFGDVYNGEQWLVARDGHLEVLDALEGRAVVMRRHEISGNASRVEALHVSATRADAVVSYNVGLSGGRRTTASWKLRSDTYALESALQDTLDLDRIHPTRHPFDPLRVVALETGAVVWCEPAPRHVGSMLLTAVSPENLDPQGRGRRLQVPRHLQFDKVTLASGARLASIEHQDRGVTVSLHDAASLDPRATWSFDHARSVRVRAFEDIWVMVDDLGRVVVCDAGTGEVVQDMRV